MSALLRHASRQSYKNINFAESRPETECQSYDPSRQKLTNSAFPGALYRIGASPYFLNSILCKIWIVCLLDKHVLDWIGRHSQASNRRACTPDNNQREALVWWTISEALTTGQRGFLRPRCRRLRRFGEKSF